jgi:hypothetical protein
VFSHNVGVYLHTCLDFAQFPFLKTKTNRLFQDKTTNVVYVRLGVWFRNTISKSSIVSDETCDSSIKRCILGVLFMNIFDMLANIM